MDTILYIPFNGYNLIDCYYNNDYTGQPDSEFTIYLALKTDNVDFQTELLNNAPVTTIKLKPVKLMSSPLDLDLNIMNNPLRTTKIFKFNVIETLNNGLNIKIPPDNYSARTLEQKQNDLIVSIKQNASRLFSASEMTITTTLITINIINEQKVISHDSQLYKDSFNLINNIYYLVGYLRERFLKYIGIKNKLTDIYPADSLYIEMVKESRDQLTNLVM